jgi:hypothetical protein
MNDAERTSSRRYERALTRVEELQRLLEEADNRLKATEDGGGNEPPPSFGEPGSPTHEEAGVGKPARPPPGEPAEARGEPPEEPAELRREPPEEPDELRREPPEDPAEPRQEDSEERARERLDPPSAGSRKSPPPTRLLASVSTRVSITSTPISLTPVNRGSGTGASAIPHPKEGIRWAWVAWGVASVLAALIIVSIFVPVGHNVRPEALSSDAASPHARIDSSEAADKVRSSGVMEREVPVRWPGERHVNAAAGYSFLHPDSWRLEENGEVSTISSPDGRFVVSFALGPEGPLPVTYESFVDLLEESYRDVRLESHEAVDSPEGPSVLVGGSATSSSGAEVRWRALLLGADSGGPAIGAIAATGSTGPFDSRLTYLLKSVRRT